MIYAVKQGCTLCGMCASECPVGAIRLGRGGAVIDPTRCVGCGSCAENCASEAIVPVTESPYISMEAGRKQHD